MNYIRTNASKLFCVLLIFTIVAPALAQDDNASPFGNQQQQEMMETQFFMQQLMMLGHNDELQKELEIVEDQVDDVKELAQNYQKDMMKFYTDNQDTIQQLQEMALGGDTEKTLELAGEFQKKNKEFSKSYMDKAAKVLLPHQFDRLKQIGKQQVAKLTNQYSDEFGMASSMAKELDLTPAETKKLNDTITEAREEYYKSVAAAKKKANEKIMAVLSAEQKEKMKEILGDMWDQDATRRKTRENAIKQQMEAAKKRAELKLAD